MTSVGEAKERTYHRISKVPPGSSFNRFGDIVCDYMKLGCARILLVLTYCGDIAFRFECPDECTKKLSIIILKPERKVKRFSVAEYPPI